MCGDPVGRNLCVWGKGRHLITFHSELYCTYNVKLQLQLTCFYNNKVKCIIK